MPLIQVAQHAEDLERAASFFGDLLGTPPAARFDPPGLVFFDVDGVRLLLDGGAPSSLVYLGVEDLGATVARLRDRGTTIESEPHVIFGHGDDTLSPAGTDEWMAFVRDSEGNLVGLVELRSRTRAAAASARDGAPVLGAVGDPALRLDSHRRIHPHQGPPPNAVSQPGGYSLGAQAGEAGISQVMTDAGSRGSGRPRRRRSTSSTRIAPSQLRTGRVPVGLPAWPGHHHRGAPRRVDPCVVRHVVWRSGRTTADG